MTYEAELRALLERATPGPWEREGRGECWVAAPHPKLGSVPVVVPHAMQNVDDLTLIAFQRNTAAEVAAVVEAARALLTWQDPTPDGKSGRCIFCDPPADGMHMETCRWDELAAALEALDTKEGTR